VLPVHLHFSLPLIDPVHRTAKKMNTLNNTPAASGKHHQAGYIGQEKENYAIDLELTHQAVRVFPAGVISAGGHQPRHIMAGK
jgi:hypothetical protein